MAGILKIHSSSEGGESSTMASLGNHSWIEYAQDPAKPDESTTYGTWGNRNPPGLRVNEEKSFTYPDVATREMNLTDAQEEKLKKEIERYKKMGPEGWTYLSPCSTFAADAWLAATGETLKTRSWGISNPDALKQSIEQVNNSQPNFDVQTPVKKIGIPSIQCSK